MTPGRTASNILAQEKCNSHTWEANSRSASLEIPHLLWDSEGSLPYPQQPLSQINPAQTISLNIILPLTPRILGPKCFLFLSAFLTKIYFLLSSSLLFVLHDPPISSFLMPFFVGVMITNYETLEMRFSRRWRYLCCSPVLWTRGLAGRTSVSEEHTT